MCGIWKRGNRLTELELRDWLRIARILRRWRLGRVVLTGGEPFIRKDLEQIVEGFANQGFSITLLTNGTLPTQARFNAVLAAGVHDVGISLDSLSPTTQSAIAGREQITGKILQTIEWALNRAPGIVEAMITASQINLREIPELVRTLDAMGAYSVVNPVNIAVSSMDESILAVQSGVGLTDRLDAALVDEVYDCLMNYKRAGVRILNSSKFLEASRDYLKSGRMAWRCDAGDRYFTIFSDGSMAGCSDLSPFRNLAREGMRPTTRWMKIRYRNQRIRCAGCIYSCWRELSYLFNDPRTMWERTLDSVRLLRREQRRDIS